MSNCIATIPASMRTDTLGTLMKLLKTFLLSDIKPSILIVDDEAMNREVLNVMLVELGYTNNDQAFSGNGALQ